MVKDRVLIKSVLSTTSTPLLLNQGIKVYFCVILGNYNKKVVISYKIKNALILRGEFADEDMCIWCGIAHN